MFVLKKNNRFEWPVDVQVPVDGGKTATHRFTAVFDVIPTARMEEFMQLPMLEQDRAIAPVALVGWGDDVKDENGDAIPFNDETRDEMLELPFVRTAVVRAYFDAMGGGKAARKN